MEGASVSNKLGVEKGVGWNTFTITPNVCLLVLRKLSKVTVDTKKPMLGIGFMLVVSV
jgi:hypothetical protein